MIIYVPFLFPQKSKARRRIFGKNSLEFEIFKTRSKIFAFSHTKRLESSQRKLKFCVCELFLCIRLYPCKRSRYLIRKHPIFIIMPKIIFGSVINITTVMPSFPSTTCTNKDITEFSLLLINSLQKKLILVQMASLILIQLIYSIICSSKYMYVCYGCYY